MQIYRIHWLACLAAALCLIAGATPPAPGLRTHAAQAEFTWDSNVDVAVLTRTDSVSSVRSSVKLQPNAFRSSCPVLRHSEYFLPGECYGPVIHSYSGARRGSDYLAQSNDNPRAPPRPRSA
jgi:hypothetical protein